MQKGYITFSTLTAMNKEGEEAVRSRWADLVQETASKHTKYVNQIMQGSFYDGIERDPRLHADADEKMDLKTLSGYQALSS